MTQETATQQPDSVMAEGHVIAGVQRLVHEIRTYKCYEVHLGQRFVLVSIVLKLERLRKQGVQLVLAIQQQPHRGMRCCEVRRVQLGGSDTYWGFRRVVEGAGEPRTMDTSSREAIVCGCKQSVRMHEEEEENECLTGRDHQAHVVLQRLFHHRVGSIRPANGDVDEPIERDVNLKQAVRAKGKRRGSKGDWLCGPIACVGVCELQSRVLLWCIR